MPSFNKVDESQLVKAAINGDPDAFGELYELYAAAVFRFLYAHMGNRLDAEDLTEDVFMRVWRSLPAYREQGIPFQAYLFRVARHAMIDTYRKSGQNRQTVSTEDVLLPDHQPGPAEQVGASLEQQQMRETMSHLNEDYRTVLILRFFMDFSTEETAGAMGRSPGAVRVLQHRALLALRSLLDGK